MIKKTTTPLNIAMIGTRGIPARYGGFETCVEEVGKRLVQMGHKVTVYCRSCYYPDRPREAFGMRLVFLPSIRKKSLDTLSHTFLTVLHAVAHRQDVYMVFNAANAPLLGPLRLLGRRIAVNTDGLEWKRSKWGWAGRMYYKFSEQTACLFANRLVSDCEGIRNHYLDAYGADSTVLSYGAYCQTSDTPVHLQQYGLVPRSYFLQITRFEPDNNPLLTVQAFNRLKTDKKLVLIGGAPFASKYVQAIKRESGENVILPGFNYDKDVLRDIWCNCYSYIHGNEVGGTNPALLQAMACGNYVIARDVAFNREVLAECGKFYTKNEEDLTRAMQWTLDHPDRLDEGRKKAQQRIREHYDWDQVAIGYDQLFQKLVHDVYPWPSPRHVP